MKAAFVALDECKFWQISLMLRLLRLADWQIRTLTFQARDIMTDSGVCIKANVAIEDAAPWDYQLVVLPGGRMLNEDIHNPHLLRFLRQYDAKHRPIAAACDSITCLAAAGLLGGIRVATEPSTLATWPELFYRAVPIPHEVYHDANIFTCQSHAHMAWTQAVVSALGVAFYSE